MLWEKTTCLFLTHLVRDNVICIFIKALWKLLDNKKAMWRLRRSRLVHFRLRGWPLWARTPMQIIFKYSKLLGLSHLCHFNPKWSSFGVHGCNYTCLLQWKIPTFDLSCITWRWIWNFCVHDLSWNAANFPINCFQYRDLTTRWQSYTI